MKQLRNYLTHLEINLGEQLLLSGFNYMDGRSWLNVSETEKKHHIYKSICKYNISFNCTLRGIKGTYLEGTCFEADINGL